MFKNSGRKIQKLAIAIFIAGCFYSLIFSIMLSTDPDITLNVPFHFWLFAIILLCGCGISYIIALLVYSWGELIENTSKNKNEKE